MLWDGTPATADWKDRLIPSCVGRTGNISIPGSSSANVTFSMDSDDGTLLYIDNQLLINHTGVVSTLLVLRSCLYL